MREIAAVPVRCDRGKILVMSEREGWPAGKALDEYQKALSLDPLAVRAQFLLASSYQVIGDHAFSKRFLIQALRFEPFLKTLEMARNLAPSENKSHNLLG